MFRLESRPTAEGAVDALGGTLTIETPLGTIVVAKAVDPNHPGVYIDLKRPGCEVDMPLAMVEFDHEESDLPEGQARIISRIWGDAMQEDYTVRVVHENVEKFFSADN